MGLESFKTEDVGNSSGEENNASKRGRTDEYLNESKSHSNTKIDIKEELENNGMKVNLEHTVEIEDSIILRPDVYAKAVNDNHNIIDCLSGGDVVAIEVGNIDASRVKLLSLAFDYVALVAKGDSIDDRIEVSTNYSQHNNEDVKQRSLEDMSSDSRSDRKRGPYIDAEAYKRLKNASDLYDMTVQDMLDELLLSTLDGDGRVKEPHSVLRNQLKE